LISPAGLPEKRLFGGTCGIIISDERKRKEKKKRKKKGKRKGVKFQSIALKLVFVQLIVGFAKVHKVLLMS
jgi:hypothetical protein